MSDAAQPHPAAVAKVLPSGITSDLLPGYRVKGPPELMLEQLRDLLHLVWYPYRRQRLVRKPTPRKAVHFEPHDQEQHFFPTDPPVTVKSEPQLMRGVHEGSARKPRAQ
ncbi:uncharacterized protein FPOAC1_014059 [Fusarium poae]|uniref:uncharacterized protein n=1 Tax=Fusarium poae TaxID=36050 RepID=UPI001D03DF0D|nr:uncharacterized protein FPOAC1_014059 [Fusarium poae]KAG8664166.1 hypothetical protein FPOAC1_014059 [Fusarium poae]